MSNELNVVIEAGKRVREREGELGEAASFRDRAIRKAAQAGVQKTTIAAAAGLSRQRVNQIVAAA